MTVVPKYCCYKGCSSYVNANHPCAETFFQFPKDPEKYSLWMALGQCEERSTAKYLCSNHFDSKYISNNPRRKVLLSHAMPYPYYPENGDANKTEEEIQNVVSTMENEEREEECNEIQSEKITEIQLENHDQEDNIELMLEEIHANEDKNILYNAIIQPVTSAKRKEVSSTSSQLEPRAKCTKILKAINLTKEPDHTENGDSEAQDKPKEDMDCPKRVKLTECEEKLPPNLATFIFKGEEYVQMPKTQYEDEKNNFVKQIRYYKNIVLSLKKHLDDITV